MKVLIYLFKKKKHFYFNLNGQIQWDPAFNAQCARALKYGYDYFQNQILGDINSDNQVNVLDVIVLVNYILENYFEQQADLNSDEILNILDIIDLINIILN